LRHPCPAGPTWLGNRDRTRWRPNSHGTILLKLATRTMTIGACQVGCSFEAAMSGYGVTRLAPCPQERTPPTTLSDSRSGIALFIYAGMSERVLRAESTVMVECPRCRHVAMLSGAALASRYRAKCADCDLPQTPSLQQMREPQRACDPRGDRGEGSRWLLLPYAPLGPDNALSSDASPAFRHRAKWL
jgi:hypothetical protein